MLSPSILEYERDLDHHVKNITRSKAWSKLLKIVSSDIDYLHIDVMRPPFIPRISRFSPTLLTALYKKLKNKANFDFHLMVYNPEPLIESIKKIVPPKERKKCSITLSREIYRENLGQYNSKRYNLLKIKAENPKLQNKILETHKKSEQKIIKMLKDIKKSGFKTGLALEPDTSLENITPEMFRLLDMVLLMSVYSGKGGQKFNQTVINKIKKLRRKKIWLVIQVDGGIKNHNAGKIIKAGADNLVIGSFITRSKEPSQVIKKLKTHEIPSPYPNTPRRGTRTKGRN